jgi:cytidylate kinase
MDKFFDYFDARYRERVMKRPSYEDGPVITLSRLTGCDARQVATLLVDELNRKYNTNKWRWVDKDIIHAIARELNTSNERVENFYKGIELSNLSEMLMAFSGNYVTDERVKKAIRDVVLSICKEGHVILVGRGGVALARDITDALHVRIIAPFYWRVQNMMRKNNMKMEEAEEYCIETDEKRFNLIRDFLDKKPLNIDYLFDATLNRSSYSVKELCDLILILYDKKVCRQIEERKRSGSII